MKKHSSMTAHAVLTAVWIVVALYLGFVYAPNEAAQGNAYRIMYVHVPSAWSALVAYTVIFIGSVGYIWKRSQRYDDLANAAGEVGFVFCCCLLITGPLWAKPIWGVWWVWDPRTTLTFILWLLFVAYVLLRSFFVNPSRAALLAAVVGIIGFVDVPIDYMAIRWWRTQHPQPVIMGGPDSGLPPKMLLAFLVSAGAFLCLFFYLLRLRMSMLATRREASRLRRELEDEAQDRAAAQRL
ncbi:MAG TPA: cytochrome c biogenesis protein CcsA [Terriglobia bacterium]|nr:cytochrome c biogenesis protein CcsA [Terriglobia bacterium]